MSDLVIAGILVVAMVIAIIYIRTRPMSTKPPKKTDENK